MRAPEAVATAVLGLVIAAAAALAATRPPAEAVEGARAYSALLLGPGLGRPVDLSRCAAAYDPRLGGCDLRHEPFPGAEALCADHAAAGEGGR